ncbi:tol-pal system-associated acyl-CoA thioesterase [Algirhabdus cladophorae]|uniref:tol-pal system-associated acyl-CoA thioesterase n=1 Tax=Algirhabdus cladophorae TaxID=3377108 RepID=UPI003B8454C7
MSHLFDLRVYYEDTDFGGIVYYANYLKFIERARSEMVRDMGIDQRQMKEAGVVFAVRRVEADYIAAALYDDQLQVRTRIGAMTAARVVFEQDVWRGDQKIFAAQVTVVCIGANGQPTRLPAMIRRNLPQTHS